FFLSRRRRHTSSKRDWSSDVCSSDLGCVSPVPTSPVPTSPVPIRSAPKIAIAIVTFNRSGYLAELLDSIETMTTPPWRIVVVDRSEERRVEYDGRSLRVV